MFGNKKESVSLSSTKLEKVNETEAEKIFASRDIVELYQALDDLGGLMIGDDKISPTELKFFIGLFNTGRAEIDTIPEEYGLREKVQQLLGREENTVPVVIEPVEDLKESEAPDIELINYAPLDFIGPEGLFTSDEFLNVLKDLRLDINSESDWKKTLRDILPNVLEQARIKRRFTINELEEKYTPFSLESTGAYREWDNKQIDEVIRLLEDSYQKDSRGEEADAVGERFATGVRRIVEGGFKRDTVGIFNVDDINVLLDQKLESLAKLFGFDLNNEQVKQALILLQRIYLKANRFDMFRNGIEKEVGEAEKDIRQLVREKYGDERILSESQLRQMGDSIRKDSEEIIAERFEKDLNYLLLIIERRDDLMTSSDLKDLIANLN